MTGLVGLFFFLLSYFIGCFLFISWHYEKKRKQHAQLASVRHPSNDETDQPTRQCRRFHRSTLFSMFFMSNDRHMSSGSLDLSEHSESSGYFQSFVDRFSSLSEVVDAIQCSGFHHCDLILGIDFTASNEWQGRRTFKSHCLHTMMLKEDNPYQKVLAALSASIEPFSRNGFIHAFGFGDSRTRDRDVFSFDANGFPCTGFKEVIARYRQIARSVHLSGPTSYVPILKKAMQIVEATKRYTILVIISDGQLTVPPPVSDDETLEQSLGSNLGSSLGETKVYHQQSMSDCLDSTITSLVEASNYPLSIVLVGVGDGPWRTMHDFDDHVSSRRFDNFQFVDYHRTISQAQRKHSDAAFALHTLMEIPDQYRAIKGLGYLK